MFAKRKGRNRKAGPPVHDDLVRRQFTAERSNQLWLTDITEHRTAEGKLYLCAIKNVHSGRRIVGYSIDARVKASLAVGALRKRRRVAGSGRHRGPLGQGSQFLSRTVRQSITSQRIARFDGPGRCVRGHAAMESFGPDQDVRCPLEPIRVDGCAIPRGCDMACEPTDLCDALSKAMRQPGGRTLTDGGLCNEI